jgi:hypothetical protein
MSFSLLLVSLRRKRFSGETKRGGGVAKGLHCLLKEVGALIFALI